MDSIDKALAVRDDPRITSLPWEQQMQVRENAWNRYVARDRNLLASAGSEGVQTLRRNFLTAVPDSLMETKISPEDVISPEIDMKSGEARRIWRETKYNDYAGTRNHSRWANIEQIRREGRVTGPDTRGGLEGFLKQYNWMTNLGEITRKGADFITTGSTENPDNDPRAVEWEKFRDYVDGVYNNRNTGYRVGKTIGTIGAIGQQMAAFSTLFGSVSAPGLLTKGLQASVRAGTANSGALVRAIAPMVAQAGVEVTTGLAYNMATDMIHNRDMRLQTEPGKEILREVAFFGVGEIFADVIARGMKSAGHIYNFGRMKRTAGFAKQYESMETAVNEFISVAEGGMKEMSADSLKFLGGIDPKVRARVLEAELEVKNLLDTEPERQAEAVQEFLWKQLYKTDVKMQADGSMRVLKVDGKKLDKLVPEAGIPEFMRTNLTDLKNGEFQQAFADFGRKNSMVTIGVRGQHKFRLKAMNWNKTASTFVPKDGKVSLDNVRDWVSTQFDEKTFGDLSFRQVDTYFKGDWNAKPKEIVVPKEINGPIQAKQFADDVLAQLNKQVPGYRFKTKRLSKYITKLGKFSKYNREFLRNMPGVANPRQVGDKVELTFNGKRMTFDSYEDAGAQIHGSFFNDRDFAQYISREHNMFMEVDGNGRYTIWDNAGSKKTPRKADGATPVYEFDKVDDLFKAKPQLRPPMPIEIAPNTIIVGATGKQGLGMVASESTFTGTMDEARRYLSKFEDLGNYREVKVLENGNVIKQTENLLEYKVEFEDLGVKFETNDYDQALKFAASDMNEYAGLERLARQKGYILEAGRVGYTVHGTGIEPRAFRTKEEIKNWMGTQEDVRGLADLLGPDKELAKQVEIDTREPIAQGTGVMNKVLTKASSFMDRGTARKTGKAAFNEWLATTTGRFEKQGGESLGFFHRFRDGQQRYHQSVADFRKVLYQSFGKYDAYDRRVLGQILLKEEGNYAEIAKTLDYNLKQSDVETLDSARKMLDILGARYGITSDIFIKKYFPRLKKINPDKFVQNDQTSMKILRDAFHTGPNTDLDPFFRHVRQEDLIGASFEDDILSVLDTYIKIGERDLFFGNHIKELNDYIRTLDVETNFEEIGMLKQLRDQVSGRVYSSDQAQKVAKRINRNRENVQQIMAKENLTPRQKANAAQEAMAFNVTNTVNDMVTSSLMSIKLRIPLRNMFQVDGTTAPITGNVAVSKAKRLVEQNPEVIFDEMNKRGIMMVRDMKDPTMRRWSLRNLIRGSNQAGMNFFRTSDDWTRMVTAKAWDVLFDDAASLLRGGTVDYAQFKKLAKTQYLDEVDIKTFDELMKGGNPEQARNLLADRMTKLSIFDYDVLAKPEQWRHGVGRVASQYQTYPLQYTRMIKTILTRGGAQEKALFLGRLFMNTAMIGVFMNDLLGMRGTPMTPFGTVGISGGPLLSSVAGLYQGATGPNVTPKGLAKTTARASQTIIPFFGYAKSQTRAVMALMDGEYAAAFAYGMGGSPAVENYGEKVTGLRSDELAMEMLNFIYGDSRNGQDSFE